MKIINEVMMRFSDWEENEVKIMYWLRIKGAQRYSEVIDYVESHGVEPTWENVSTVYKKDKNILYILQRFLAFFEEYLKAGLANNFDYEFK